MRSNWSTLDWLREARPALEAVFLGGILVLSILALAVAIVPATEAPATIPATSGDVPAELPSAAPPESFEVTADTSLVFVVTIGNRMYPDWKEERRLRLQEPFVIGDTDNHGVVSRFLPDFRILDTKPVSLSLQPNNPAVRVFVYNGETAVDSTWAFLNFPPHFSPKNFYTFQLERIEGYDEAIPEAVGRAALDKEK